MADFGTGGDGLTGKGDISQMQIRVQWVRETLLNEIVQHPEMRWMPGLKNAIGALHIFERTLKLMQEGKVVRERYPQ